jgi:hypothetical protein
MEVKSIYEQAFEFVEKYYPKASQSNKLTKIGMLTAFGEALIVKKTKSKQNKV